MYLSIQRVTRICTGTEDVWNTRGLSVLVIMRTDYTNPEIFNYLC